MPIDQIIPLHHQRLGDGGRHIIFLNGFRMPFETWDKVHPTFSSANSVVLFNRRGIGRSPKATTAQDGLTVISEMRSLCSLLELDPPYVLVAHSLGGIFANLYARMYPQDVAGIIFVDATHPQEVEEQKAGKSPFGLGTINRWLKVIEKLSDEFKYSEDECILQTIEQIRHAGAFPDVPVAVVSGNKKMQFAPDKLFKSHQKYQQSLLQLSPNSKHYPCSESGHFPQITQPQRVISAISDILNETPTPR